MGPVPPLDWPAALERLPVAIDAVSMPSAAYWTIYTHIDREADQERFTRSSSSIDVDPNAWVSPNYLLPALQT